MNAYDLKQSIPNKVVQDDGTVTDIFGKAVASQDIGYKSRRSLPNKWLQPDDTYVTLQEIIAGAVDTELFIIVEELPETGKTNKIYLVPNDETGGFVEYIYVNNKWDPIGMISIDLSNYWTIEQVQQAITVALNQAKAYADGKASDAVTTANAYTDNAIANFVPLRAFPDSVVTNSSTINFFNSIKALNLPVGSMLLGLVELTDMPTGLLQAEVRIEVYDNNVLYAIMRSADLVPYVWEANSYDYRGWEQEGQTVLTQANTYADTKKSEAITAANSYTDTAIQTSITQVLGGSY